MVQVLWSAFQSGASEAQWLGSAVASKGSAVGKGVFFQSRGSARSLSVALSCVPFIFDPWVPFAISCGAKAVVAIAFQHEARYIISTKSSGRLKAMGCAIVDVFRLVAPQTVRKCWPEGIHAGTLHYARNGSEQHSLPASTWGEWSMRGPGVNGCQGLGFLVCTACQSAEALDEVLRLEGRRMAGLCIWIRDAVGVCSLTSSRISNAPVCNSSGCRRPRTRVLRSCPNSGR